MVGIADTPTTGVLLDTRDFVHPEIVEGELVLRVRPFGADGTVAPLRSVIPPRAAPHTAPDPPPLIRCP